MWRGTGRRETGRKGGGKYTGGGSRGARSGISKVAEAGEKGKNYATLRNISQSKKHKEAEANRYNAGTGIKGRFKPPCPSPPLTCVW